MCKTQSWFFGRKAALTRLAAVEIVLAHRRVSRKTRGSNCRRLAKNNSIKNTNSSLIFEFTRCKVALQIEADSLLKKICISYEVFFRPTKYLSTLNIVPRQTIGQWPSEFSGFLSKNPNPEHPEKPGIFHLTSKLL